ncbi:hypothetical protein GGI22_001631, partial [Coemansia erecta]
PGLGIRILGQKLVANGSTEAVVEDTTMFVEDLVAGVQRHRITDRIGQMYCRAVLFPTVVYRLMGQPLLDSELKKIEGPIVRFLKHAFGMPSTTPTSLIRHQKGANMPTLASVMATRNLDLTLRQMNGAGAPFFSSIARVLEDLTRRKIRFPGSILENAQHISGGRAKSRPGIGRLWYTSVARSINKYALTVERPYRYGECKTQVMTAFQKPLPDKIIDSLYDAEISEIAQAFWMTPLQGRGGTIFINNGRGDGDLHGTIGHAGNQYNTEADRLAGQAHGNEQRAWSLKIKLEDVKDTLVANAWFAAGNGKYELKNLFKKVTEQDSTERSLGFKLLLGNVPVMKQQVAWYLLAYPELEMLRCPRDHPKEAPKEMREHFLECTWGDPELLPPQPGSAVAAWMDTYTQQTIPMVGISQRDRWNALEALHQDMHPHQRTM